MNVLHAASADINCCALRFAELETALQHNSKRKENKKTRAAVLPLCAFQARNEWL